MDIRRRFLITSEDKFDYDNYMTIESLEDGVEVALVRNATGYSGNNYIEYCVDGSNNWIKLNTSTSRQKYYTQSINKGHKLSFRGYLKPYIDSSNDNKKSGIGIFSIMNGKCNLTGNCNSLLFGDNVLTNKSLEEYECAFYKLFYDCKNINNVSPNFLPADKLSKNCYGYMFSNSSLIEASNLPAQELVDSCYYHMYENCQSLTNAGEISAVKSAEDCCYSMFSGCTSLKNAPILYIEKLEKNSYYYMFMNCNSLEYIKTYANPKMLGRNSMYNWVTGVSTKGKIYVNKDSYNDDWNLYIPTGWIIQTF